MEEWKTGDLVLWTDGRAYSVWGTVDRVVNNDIVQVIAEDDGETHTVYAAALRRRPAPPKQETMLERELRTRDVWSTPFNGPGR